MRTYEFENETVVAPDHIKEKDVIFESYEDVEKMGCKVIPKITANNEITELPPVQEPAPQPIPTPPPPPRPDR